MFQQNEFLKVEKCNFYKFDQAIDCDTSSSNVNYFYTRKNGKAVANASYLSPKMIA